MTPDGTQPSTPFQIPPPETAVDASSPVLGLSLMSVQEIQSQLVKLNSQEQADAARFLETLRQTHTPEFARELADRHREMDAGRKISEAELARILAAKPATPRS